MQEKNVNTEYWKSLEKWMEDVRLLTMMAPGLPFPIIMPLPDANTIMFTPPSNVAPAFTTSPDPVQNFRTPVQFIEHRIPHLWKRFVAELIDFIILFFMKLAITFIAVDFFEIVDFDKYNIQAFQNDNKIDYELALEMTSELIMLELIHRIVVCCYEAVFLAQAGEAGGATPGKSLMGLRVVSCEQILPVLGGAPDRVLLCPAGAISYRFSILRAVLKNLVLAFVFPVCFPLFFNKFNRAGYDIICRSIVIEDLHPQLRH